jgi:hypothetical protein
MKIAVPRFVLDRQRGWELASSPVESTASGRMKSDQENS